MSVVKLTDLSPRWIHPDLFIFKCPHCRSVWLSCKRVKMGISEQMALFAKEAPGETVAPCNPDVAWWMKGSFENGNFHVKPSIDAGKAGHWHGHIVGGEISDKPAPEPAKKAAKAGGIPCYYLEPIEPVRTRRWLRRYQGLQQGEKCSGRMGYHNAQFLLGDFDGEVADEQREAPPLTDPRWPAACTCGYRFKDDDHRQIFTNHLFRRSDNGQLETLHEAGVGAMWFAPWFSDHPAYRGPDGKTLIVRLPHNHDWIVDGRASNCTMPKDNEHKCWIRHGAPPDVTVDKRGKTCAAGAGSIQTGKWHGFLRNGHLVP